ncbi:Nicotinate-nucleotide--dimethylbenzimidazole phosphoribosyltransferase [Rhodobacteraceae bacterium LE17]|nr:Nicotinate-nucleotide--dimethylbenzimidazole phosphoribosyltransferase [Rhodobacteraceae bacterium LE17]
MRDIFSVAEFRDFMSNLPAADDSAGQAATERNAQLTKPPGALGDLEDLAIWYARWSGQARPRIDAPQVVIFAGNHGVAAAGVSAFPPEVTQQMVYNFQAGGAAINQISKTFGAKMDVVALELDRPTQDFTQGPAMTESDLLSALQTGWRAVDRQADLFVAGEMGIGNTTPAAAIAAALLGGAVQDWVGRGTGVDDAGLAKKCSVVEAGLARHVEVLHDPLAVLQALGGREIAAMAGSIAAARAHGIPVLLDGFICSASALVLHAMNPVALDHTQAGHKSAEGAHARLLQHLGKTPLLSLGLRLGEGSGGALAIGVLKGAVACLSGMATFAEAGVSDA